MKIDIKDLLLKIYFELGYYEEIYSLTDTYRHYLKKDKLITEHTNKYNLAFLNNIIKLVRCKQNPIKKDIDWLKNSALKSGHFKNKEWLLEKITELETNPIKLTA